MGLTSCSRVTITGIVAQQTSLRNGQGFTFPKRKYLAANKIAEYI